MHVNYHNSKCTSQLILSRTLVLQLESLVVASEGVLSVVPCAKERAQKTV
jgi:hypothetical protein